MTVAEKFFKPINVLGVRTENRAADLRRFKLQVELMAHLFKNKPPVFSLNTFGESIPTWRADLTDLFTDLRFGIEHKPVTLDIYSEVPDEM